MTRVFAGNNFDGWRKHMTRCLLIAVSLLLLAQAARAQASEPSWNRLRIFHVGDKIQVVDQNLKSQNGTFIAFSDDAITYQMDQDAVTMQRDDVYRVSSLKSMSRTKHALIGLGIGAAWGLAFNPRKVDIWLNGFQVCDRGLKAAFVEAEVQLSMEEAECTIRFRIRGKGKGRARFWTCDFTEAYIKINAEYRT
jgi:hypothetical protein